MVDQDAVKGYHAVPAGEDAAAVDCAVSIDGGFGIRDRQRTVKHVNTAAADRIAVRQGRFGYVVVDFKPLDAVDDQAALIVDVDAAAAPLGIVVRLGDVGVNLHIVAETQVPVVVDVDAAAARRRVVVDFRIGDGECAHILPDQNAAAYAGSMAVDVVRDFSVGDRAGTGFEQQRGTPLVSAAVGVAVDHDMIAGVAADSEDAAVGFDCAAVIGDVVRQGRRAGDRDRSALEQERAAAGFRRAAGGVRDRIAVDMGGSRDRHGAAGDDDAAAAAGGAAHGVMGDARIGEVDLRAVADVDAAALVGGRVAVDEAVGDRHGRIRIVGEDAAAPVGGRIVRNCRSGGHCELCAGDERHAATVHRRVSVPCAAADGRAVQGDRRSGSGCVNAAAAAVGGGIQMDADAAVQRQGAGGPDAAAVAAGCRIVADRAGSQRYRSAVGVNAAAVSRCGIVGDHRSIDHGQLRGRGQRHTAAIQRGIRIRRAAADDRAVERQRCTGAGSENTAAVALERAVRDHREVVVERQRRSGPDAAAVSGQRRIAGKRSGGQGDVAVGGDIDAAAVAARRVVPDFHVGAVDDQNPPPRDVDAAAVPGGAAGGIVVVDIRLVRNGQRSQVGGAAAEIDARPVVGGIAVDLRGSAQLYRRTAGQRSAAAACDVNAAAVAGCGVVVDFRIVDFHIAGAVDRDAAAERSLVVVDGNAGTGRNREIRIDQVDAAAAAVQAAPCDIIVDFDVFAGDGQRGLVVRVDAAAASVAERKRFRLIVMDFDIVADREPVFIDVDAAAARRAVVADHGVGDGRSLRTRADQETAAEAVVVIVVVVVDRHVFQVRDSLDQGDCGAHLGAAFGDLVLIVVPADHDAVGTAAADEQAAARAVVVALDLDRAAVAGFVVIDLRGAGDEQLAPLQQDASAAAMDAGSLAGSNCDDIAVDLRRTGDGDFAAGAVQPDHDAAAAGSVLVGEGGHRVMIDLHIGQGNFGTAGDVYAAAARPAGARIRGEGHRVAGDGRSGHVRIRAAADVEAASITGGRVVADVARAVRGDCAGAVRSDCDAAAAGCGVVGDQAVGQDQVRPVVQEDATAVGRGVRVGDAGSADGAAVHRHGYGSTVCVDAAAVGRAVVPYRRAAAQRERGG